MAKKCNYCNMYFDDNVLYCKICGRSLAPYRKSHHSGHHHNGGYQHYRSNSQDNAKEWLPLILAILGLLIVWEVNYMIGGALGIGALVMLNNPNGCWYRATTVTKIISVIDIVLMVLTMLVFL
ncbi:MAG: hypothetical protein J6V25_08715 [Oscillospiraceae bacterium]|nr:hypothetical protein [Oscillospiraceae bacterium]